MYKRNTVSNKRHVSFQNTATEGANLSAQPSLSYRCKIKGREYPR